MKMIKRALIAIVLLMSLFVVRSYAQAACTSGTCAPCGAVSTNVSNTPSDSINLNPYNNYLATSQPCSTRGYFGGFYLGAAYGLGIINYHLQVDGQGPDGLDEASRTYLVAIANAGFNLVIEHFALGIEFGYNYRSRSNPTSYFDEVDFFSTRRVDLLDDLPRVTTEPCKIRFDINSQHAATADLLPGIVFSRFIAYLRLGAEQANYSIMRRVCFPEATLVEDGFVGTVTDQDYVFTRKQNATGYRLGVGFGFAVCPNVSLHLNYIHTFTSKITITPDVSAILANPPVLIPGDIAAPVETLVNISQLASDFAIEPQRDEVNFGVRFRF